MKKLLKVLFLAFVLSLLIACGSDTDDTDEASQNADTNGEVATSEDASEEAAYPRTFTDAVGNEITFEEEPERIISLAPSNTEITYALGQGDKVVGLTDNDNFPEEVSEIESVGGMEFNVEMIVGLDPDVVLAHESGVAFAQEAYDQLNDAGVNLFIVEDAQDINATYETIESVGQVLGAEEKAEQIVTEMKEGFAEIEEITAEVADEDRQSVFFETSPAPEIYTAGKNTFLNELLEVAGADNAAGEQDGWVAMDPEAIIELNPDVIITTYGSYVEDAFGEVMSRDGFDVVDAVANERVYDLDSDKLSRSGPRLVEGARELAEAVYPELFDEE